jgi:hypothetical protein
MLPVVFSVLIHGHPTRVEYYPVHVRSALPLSVREIAVEAEEGFGFVVVRDSRK